LNGIVQKLDYLNDGTESSLGIDAIWLSPIFPSPMADFGYDVADYCNIDPLFGDLTTFDRLVAEAHRRGIRIIIDYVPNHTSNQHSWFLESRRSRNNPMHDWYIWRDPKPDGSPPNNWGSFFGGRAWTFDAATRQCYLHQFLKEQPELNWRNPEVREAMINVLRFWMRRGVDGFRTDAIALLIKDAQFRDNPPDHDAPPDLRPNDIFGRQLHSYTQDQDEVHNIIRDIRRVLDEFDDLCAIGELPLSIELPRWVKYYGKSGDELDLPFNFRLMLQPWRAEAMRRSVDELERALPPFAWPNYVLGNHDQARLATRLGGQAQARVAAMMLLTLRGTPTLYYGDELGLTNGVILPEQIQDPLGVNLGPERTRDVCRTPMQWDPGPHAGFSTAEAWLPVSADYRTRNVAVESSDRTSILNLYRRLLWGRRKSSALHGGSYRPVNVGADCFAYIRQAGDELWLIVLNFTESERRISVPVRGSGQVSLSTHLDREEPVSLSSLRLRPHEGVMVEVK
jgi:alpha-glucosidase